ncbi:ABC transporter ATP-binding protein [Propionicimonas sp.]|uniref:ABC transporter ATP-binding protein n=1 Tax=Propionicimonas sp. TaxID=1955623 RepID=UPI0039E68A14
MRPGELVLDDLRVSGDAELLRGVTLALEPGGALGVVGESGSGKSLTLRAVMGLLPRGLRVSGGTIGVGGTAAMIFQDPLTFLDPLARVGDQVAEVCAAATGLTRREARARALRLFDDVHLPDAGDLLRRYPHQLSGGQRQRVLLAVALAREPDLLLCDEPTTALDVTVQRGVLDLLAQLRAERGLSVLFVSHDLAVVAQVCDRIVVLHEGRVVESGDTLDVVTRPAEPYTRSLLDAVLPLPELAGGHG